MIKEFWINGNKIKKFKGIRYIDVLGEKWIIERHYWTHKGGNGFMVEVEKNTLYDTINFGKIVGKNIIDYFEGEKNGTW